MKIIVPRIADEPLSCDERSKLIEVARSYVGTPWIHMGRSRKGVDCAGLLIVVVREVLGVAPVVSDYSPWPNMKLMRDICNKVLLPKPRMDDIEIGDIVLMYATGVGVVHLGWYAGDTLIHSSNEPNARRVVESVIPVGLSFRGVFKVPRYVK